MQITFDTSDPKDLQFLSVILQLVAPTTDAQPEVAINPGSAASGSASFTEGSAVTEGADEASTVAESAPSAPVEKTKRGRKPKAEAAQPVVEQEADEAQQELPLVEPTAEPAKPAKPLTIDDVRGALQQFTASNGVPAGVALLKEFEASRISELAEDRYVDFVARCAA